MTVTWAKCPSCGAERTDVEQGWAGIHRGWFLPTCPNCATETDPVMVTGCTYQTSLNRECGREATTGPHCDFHAVLSQLDDWDFTDPTPIVVPASQRPLVDRILSDVQANFDAMPWKRWSQGLPIWLSIPTNAEASIPPWSES